MTRATRTTVRTVARVARVAGAIEPGCLADFLVLVEDPLTDVHHLAEIELVVHAGSLLEP